MRINTVMMSVMCSFSVMFVMFVMFVRGLSVRMFTLYQIDSATEIHHLLLVAYALQQVPLKVNQPSG